MKEVMERRLRSVLVIEVNGILAKDDTAKLVTKRR